MAIAFGASIGTNFAGGSPGTSVILTTSGAVAAGGRVIVAVGWYADSNGATCSVAGGSLSWAQDGYYQSTSDANRRVGIFSAYAASGLASSTAITATFTANSYTRMICGCYATGVASASYQDGAVAGNTGSSAVATWATGGLTTTNSDDLLISAAWVDFTAGSSTPDGSYPEWADFQNTTDTNTMVAQYRIVSSTGTYTSSGTWSTITQYWQAALVAYKAATVGDYEAEVLADTPWLYWKLDEPSGTTATDSSGNSRDGTYSGSPTLAQSGLITAGTSVGFDATNDYCLSSSAIFNSSDCTVEVWFDYDGTPPTTGAYSAIAGCIQGDGGGVTDKVIQIDTGSIPMFYLYDGGIKRAVGAAPLTTGVHHLVGTYTGGTATLYVDGAVAGTIAATGTYTGYSGPNCMVASTNGTWDRVAGRRDEFALYTTALSAARILAHYDAGIAAAAVETQSFYVSRRRTVSR